MGVTEDLAPSFTQKPQLRQEDDGNRLIFQCQLVGSPKPEVTWFRGETQLTENDRTTFSVKEVAPAKYAVSLEIDDVVETDGGLYKVKARNKLGEVSASISLNFSRKLTLSSCHADRLTRPVAFVWSPATHDCWPSTTKLINLDLFVFVMV